MWQPGCTVIDATEGSYCFVLPAEDSFHGEDDKQGQERFRSLSCRPLSGHEWLSAFGLQSEEALVDDVCASGDDENAPVMSMAALHEAWPSFLLAENQDSKGTDKVNNQEAKNEVPVTRKGKRRPASLDYRDHGFIEGLLKSGSKSRLIQMKRKNGFRRTLKRFVREHPEQFRAECRGAVSLLLAALVQNRGQTTHLDLGPATDTVDIGVDQ